MTHALKIKNIEDVTHNVRQFTLEKPEGFLFEPGQATDVAIDMDGWRDQKRPFTFTSLPEWEDLQFTIKMYPDHQGMTQQLGRLAVGDRFLIDDSWGTIAYKGKGVFIAGGAGVTPFIAILRDRQARGEIAGHTLIFANRTEKDIILREEFEAMDGLKIVHVLSDEKVSGCEQGFVDEALLKKHVEDFAQHFYVCGPDPMVDDLLDTLESLGAEPDGLVFEK